VERPFLFFDAIFLEKYFLGLIMLLDIVYDIGFEGYMVGFYQFKEIETI